MSRQSLKLWKPATTMLTFPGASLRAIRRWIDRKYRDVVSQTTQRTWNHGHWDLATQRERILDRNNWHLTTREQRISWLRYDGQIVAKHSHRRRVYVRKLDRRFSSLAAAGAIGLGVWPTRYHWVYLERITAPSDEKRIVRSDRKRIVGRLMFWRKMIIQQWRMAVIISDVVSSFLETEIEIRNISRALKNIRADSVQKLLLLGMLLNLIQNQDFVRKKLKFTFWRKNIQK